jgi:hypothetical protein
MTEEKPGKYGMSGLYEVGIGFIANTMKWRRNTFPITLN